MIIFAVTFFYVCPKSAIALYVLEVVMPVMILMFFFLAVFTLWNAYDFNV